MCSKEKFSQARAKKFEETFDIPHPRTTYLLVDIKVVYIVTFAFITSINLISSTANIHASNDKSNMTLFIVS